MFQITPAPTIEIAIGRKISRLGEVLEAAAISEGGDQQAQADAESGADDDPHQVVAEGGEHIGIREHRQVVRQADEGYPVAVEQAEPEGAHRRQRQVPHQDGDGRADEDERLDQRAPAVAQPLDEPVRYQVQKRHAAHAPHDGHQGDDALRRIGVAQEAEAGVEDKEGDRSGQTAKSAPGPPRRRAAPGGPFGCTLSGMCCMGILLCYWAIKEARSGVAASGAVT